MYDGLIFKPYWNQIFYPNGTIKKYHDVLINAVREKLQSIKEQSRSTKDIKTKEEIINKALPSKKDKIKNSVSNLRFLANCQSNYMQVVLQKIDRKSKPIKKQEKLCSNYLENRGFKILDPNFDLHKYLENRV